MPYESPLNQASKNLSVVIGILLFIPIIVVGLMIAIPLALIAPFLPKRQMTARQVAEAIREFLEDDVEDWHWDDFTSNSIADPRLDSIVQRADAVPLPLDQDGEAELRRLIAEAEALSLEPTQP